MRALYCRLSGEGVAANRQTRRPGRNEPAPDAIGLTRRLKNCCAAVSERRGGAAMGYGAPKNVLARTGVAAMAAVVRPIVGATRSRPAVLLDVTFAVMPAMTFDAIDGPNAPPRCLVMTSRPSRSASRSRSTTAWRCHAKKACGEVGVVVPLLGEVLARWWSRSRRTTGSVALCALLDEQRHPAEHIAQQVELGVVDELRHAVFVALRQQGREDDRDRRQGRLDALEMDVAMALGDLNDATQDALEAVAVGEGLDLGALAAGHRAVVRELTEGVASTARGGRTGCGSLSGWSASRPERACPEPTRRPACRLGWGSTA